MFIAVATAYKLGYFIDASSSCDVTFICVLHSYNATQYNMLHMHTETVNITIYCFILPKYNGNVNNDQKKQK